MNYRTIHQLSKDQVAQLLVLYRNEWWTKDRKLNEIEIMLKHTDLVFGLVEESTDRLVGFARVLTDRVYKAVLLDVIVHPDIRQRGLGRRLMDLICSHPDLEKVEHFDLFCLSELVPFYEAWGFTTELGNLEFMRCDLSAK